MSDVLSEYKRAEAPLPESYRLWPLYGAGFQNLGKEGQMLEVDLPEPGPEELLVRHDACGICFSDIKVIRTGQNHPRIHRNMAEKPVVLGHEVTLTIVGVGENLRDRYHIGDRFIVQADIYIKGVAYAYGYELQGGFSQYSIVDWRVLNGDGGNYLLPVRPQTGYAEAALNEPWACVVASYTVDYRSHWKDGGSVWIVGDGRGVGLGKAAGWRPGEIVLDVSNAEFAHDMRRWGYTAGATVHDGDDGQRKYDDIVILSNDPDLIERAFKRLAHSGTFAVVSDEPVQRMVQLDIGRIHYDKLALIGTTTGDISAAYTPIRTELKAGGSMWTLGAGGPMGHMHVQRAIELNDHPQLLVASNLHLARIQALDHKFGESARAKGINFVPVSLESFAGQAELDAYLDELTRGEGFDDIVVNAPSTATIENALPHLAENGVMNVFAGLPRGTMCGFDINLTTQRNIRFTGMSGSSISDLRRMLDMTESHELVTNRSVAAVAGLDGLPEGLKSVSEGAFAGKVVIYPHIRGLPLTKLEELPAVLPSVAAKLDADGSWTNAAEEELLRTLLPR